MTPACSPDCKGRFCLLERHAKMRLSALTEAARAAVFDTLRLEEAAQAGLFAAQRAKAARTRPPAAVHVFPTWESVRKTAAS